MSDRDYLLARLAKIKEMIKACTAEDVMTLLSLEDEAAEINRELAKAE